MKNQRPSIRATSRLPVRLGRRATRAAFSVLRAMFIVLAGATACTGPAADDAPNPAPNDAEVSPEVTLVRTANPELRGYGEDVFPRVQELAPNVYSYEQLRSAGEEQFTTVSLFVVTTDGVMVADGQGSVAETQLMIDHIAEVTDQPIRAVVVASDHGDHTAGNSAFPEGTTFIAHPTSVANMEAAARNRSAETPPVAIPTTTVEGRESVRMGETDIEVVFLGRAHTGGDLSVYLPKEKILFMSEAYLHRVFPAMRTAYPSEWVRMIEQAQDMDVDIYVPGHGFVDSPAILKEELETFRSAIVTVIDEANRLHAEGLTLAEARDRATFGDLENWSLRSSQGSRAIQQVYAEINGELPGGAR